MATAGLAGAVRPLDRDSTRRRRSHPLRATVRRDMPSSLKSRCDLIRRRPRDRMPLPTLMVTRSRTAEHRRTHTRCSPRPPRAWAAARSMPHLDLGHGLDLASRESGRSSAAEIEVDLVHCHRSAPAATRAARLSVGTQLSGACSILPSPGDPVASGPSAFR